MITNTVCKDIFRVQKSTCYSRGDGHNHPAPRVAAKLISQTSFIFVLLRPPLWVKDPNL